MKLNITSIEFVPDTSEDTSDKLVLEIVTAFHSFQLGFAAMAVQLYMQFLGCC